MFFVEGKPEPQGAISHNKQGYGFHANDKKLRVWRDAIGWTAKQHFKQPLEGAVSLSLHFYLLRPKSVTRDYPVTRPDLDHYIRAVNDALSGIAFFDDSQVVSILATKQYDSRQGVTIQLKQGGSFGIDTYLDRPVSKKGSNV